MNQKLEITRYAMIQNGIEITEKSLKKILHTIWVNPRLKKSGGFQLTPVGLEFLTKADIKEYRIKFEDPIEVLSNKEILWLDRYVDCPFYIDFRYRKIIVFSERTAVQLALFSGKILDFAKVRSKVAQAT